MYTTPLFRERSPVPVEKKAVYFSELLYMVWRKEKPFVYAGVRTYNRPARSVLAVLSTATLRSEKGILFGHHVLP